MKKKIKKETTIIAKEKIWQALRWKLSDEELAEIPYNDIVYENDYYFDLELMLDKIHRFMNGEKPRRYFMDWCLIYMRCLMSFMPHCNKTLNHEYYQVGDTFDAFAFNDGTPEECRWLIAYLKWHAHRIKNATNKADTEFETNGVLVYIRPDAYIEESDTDLYQVLIVDNSEKKFNIVFIEGIDYDEHINYSFADYDEDLVDIVCDRFAHCKLDNSLNLDYFKLKAL
ncbi:MAG: hypothetical protein K2O67_03420 [Clostridia bacterium]|nr:hypothetical protein [Clostridia bacterium]